MLKAPQEVCLLYVSPPEIWHLKAKKKFVVHDSDIEIINTAHIYPSVRVELSMLA